MTNTPTPTPVVDPVRVNAMFTALQQQRDAALNQVVLLSAELASVRDELEKATARMAEPTPRTPDLL